MVEKIGKILTELRESAGLTQEEMAEVLGIKRARYSSWENEIAKPDIEMLGKIAEYHGVSTDYFYGKKTHNYIQTSDSDLLTVPIIAEVPAGYPRLADEDIVETIQIPKTYTDQSGKIFGIKIKGDSMTNLGIDDGDTVIVRLQPTAENGQTVIAKVDGEEVTCKRFYRTNGRVTLEPANGKYRPLSPEQVEIIGIVFKVIKDMY